MPVAPRKYTEVITIKITPVQKKTLDKLRGYKIPVARFIREAIREKINREHKELKPKPKKEYNPFG